MRRVPPQTAPAVRWGRAALGCWRGLSGVEGGGWLGRWGLAWARLCVPREVGGRRRWCGRGFRENGQYRCRCRCRCRYAGAESRVSAGAGSARGGVSVVWLAAPPPRSSAVGSRRDTSRPASLPRRCQPKAVAPATKTTAASKAPRHTGLRRADGLGAVRVRRCHRGRTGHGGGAHPVRRRPASGHQECRTCGFRAWRWPGEVLPRRWRG